MRNVLVILSLFATSTTVFASSGTSVIHEAVSKVICSKSRLGPSELNLALLEARDAGYTEVSAPTVALSNNGPEQMVVCVTATRPKFTLGVK